ncbi:MAG: thioesterase family protein [Acidimicrobiales bacterium]
MSAPSRPTCTFAEVSTVAPTGPGCFHAEVDAGWTIGGKPNGGYLLAMLGRAATSVSTHDHVIAASAHYLDSPEPGPVDIRADVLRAGRSANQIRAGLSQDGKPCVEALVTASRLDGATVPYWDRGLPEVGVVAFEDCSRLVPQTPDGIPVAMMEQIDVRLEPGSRGFAGGRPSGRGELRGWLALPGGEPFDPVSLLFAVDAFPPATFDIERAGWVPTLELTAYVRALPVPGPLRVLQRARLVEAQRVDESCFVWDQRGRLVAQATQLAGIRLG